MLERNIHSMLHTFKTDVSAIPLPEKFTYPFHYTPHPLCLLAAKEVQEYLLTQKQWQEELDKGKMFGVLIVRTSDGEIGYLAAFSGNLAHQNVHPFFVPPVYDLLQPDGFFRIEEQQISAINRKITQLEQSEERKARLQQRDDTNKQGQLSLAAAKQQMKEAQKRRELRRAQGVDDAEQQEMIRESQFQKAEYKRLEKRWKEQIDQANDSVACLDQEMEQLKAERKSRSAALQLRLFNQFQFLNAKQETRGLPDIFAETIQKTPPAGAGECAAPKLLQYAFLHQWHPIAMAEFWWGESPKAEIRHHGHYYPACKGKCEPILKHMLQGLDVEENPLLTSTHENPELEIVYEDEWLFIVNKPAGMLSVPGKEEGVKSLFHYVMKRFPQTEGPFMVHRLDMATSGLLIIAKTKEVHKLLQQQFKEHCIQKRYIALVDGHVEANQGYIDLPLCLNPLDRPRQMVHAEWGKPSLTRYVVLERTPHHTRIAFYPHTGRTHQLRVHAAHRAGLDAPIIGDELYGRKDKRLFLHAESVEFTHPITGQRIKIEKPADF